MVSDIDFALCTHIHKDHSAGIKQLLHHGIDVFTNREVMEQIDGTKWLKSKNTATLRGWSITPFNVPHTNTDGTDCENYAYLIDKDGERLLYMTDWMYCPYKLARYNIHNYLIAVNYTDLEEEDEGGKISHVVRGHSSLATTQDFLKASMTPACKNVIACHLSRRNANPKVVLAELSNTVWPNVNVAIAKKGMRLEL